MPNTKSAQRRVRSSARQQLRNQTVKSRLKSLERKYLSALQGGQKEDAGKALIEVTSALDKAAKRRVMHWATVDRKKSRLALGLAALKA